jgi:hypothetical protein
MDAKAPHCQCHELRRVKSYPPDPPSSDISSELRSASTLTTLTDENKHEEVSARPTSFWDAVRHLHSLFYLVAFSTTFSVLNCLFVYYVLLKQYVETPGPVMWDATKTNVSPAVYHAAPLSSTTTDI